VRLIVSEKSWRKRRAVRPADFTAHSNRRRSALPRARRHDPVEIPEYVRLADIRAVVEILPGADGEPSEHLLWKTYRASWGGVIALALNGVTIAAVNRVMDRIVPQFPLTIRASFISTLRTARCLPGSSRMPI
jgi:hypothetical protein